jgi:adenine-specific DNA-methyltransferase
MDPGGIDEDGNLVNQAWANIPKGKEYLKLKAQADRAPARTVAGMEPLVYNHLYDFFSRYYDTGDFIPKRRRSFAPDGRDTYAIPWDGEEVVLHWANKDQYYIKTGDRFTHYRWQSEAGGRTFTVEFRLTDADLPANNNKDAKKKFNLLVADKVEWQEGNSTLILHFHYRGLTPEEEGQYIGTQEAKLRDSIIKRTVETLREMPAIVGVPQLVTALMAPKRDAAGKEKRDKDGNAVPLLPHHLNRWAVKNESDFFIHKDLRRFLSGELDYFLKSVVLNLDNLLAAGEHRAEPNFRLLEAVKRLGTEIVDFVSQLEDFQKALFEKKKFVLETSWSLTLDRIPASVKEEVYVAILANDRQWEEWETLYKISQWPADLATVAPRTREFLDAYPFLMIDTATGYGNGMVDKLLEQFEDIDAQTDGTIIHSENFQAVTFLEEFLNEAAQCVYIDPPYNTSENAFTYKNAYKHSSWLAMVEPVLKKAHRLVREDGAILAAIDDTEYSTLKSAIGRNFGDTNYAGTIAAEVNPAGQNIRPNVPARSHDYFHIYAKDIEFAEMATRDLTEEEIASYSLEDDRGKYLWDNLRRRGGNSRPADRPKQWYPIYRDGTKLRVPSMEWSVGQKKYVNIEATIEGEVEEWPIDPHGENRIWRTNPKGARDGILKGDIQVIQKAARWEVSKKSRIPKGKKPKTLWKDGRHSATTFGTKLLIDILGPNYGFSYPKSVHLVRDAISNWISDDSLILDYFGGSGTTGHAVVQLNREDQGSRKYILVEMGSYFATVLKPRLKKVVFSENWEMGVPKPQVNPNDPNNPYNGVSHCIKMLRLESYEDALDNIEFNSVAAPVAELGLEFRRDYELRYALDWESKDCPTRMAVEQLDTPFDYTLTLRRESGTVEVKPDLPETFAYLIGLHTRRRFRTERDGGSYLIYTGSLHADGTEVAVLWRTCKGWIEANLKAEMDWWREQRETLAPGVTRVYVNGASAIEGHYSLDAEFKTLMHGHTT